MAVNKPNKSYFQSFKENYSKEFPSIKSSAKGVKFAFCTICHCDFNISHGGRYDISRHVKGPKHMEKANCIAGVSKVSSFFKSDSQEVIRAELFFTSFIVEHNLPISIADHAGPLFRKMFPKSEVAKLYGSARTKTTALIKTMAMEKTEHLVQCLKTTPFSTACDGSNDCDSKLYPIVVNFFSPSEKCIQSSLLSLPNLIGDATGENISCLIIKEFERFQIPFQNCIAFGADNASVMQGKRKGVITHLRKRCENLISIGCPCHLVNLASEKGAATLPIKIDEIIIDIFYYLKQSVKRKECLKKYQELYNKDSQKILKHVCTRWLSLGKSLQRLIDQWDPLEKYFHETVKNKNNIIPESLASFNIPQKKTSNDETETVKTNLKRKRTIEVSDNEKKSKQKCFSVNPKSKNTIISREEKLFMFLTLPINKAYSYFLLNSIKVFEQTNILLQCKEPLIHKLKDILSNLLRELLTKFIKPSVIKSTILYDIEYHSPCNQKDNSDLIIGTATSEIVLMLSDAEKHSFYSSVLTFFITSCDYIVNKFPVKDELLHHLEVCDAHKLEQAKFASVKYFITRFPFLLSVKENETRNEALDEMEKQFSSIQVEDLTTILARNERVDAIWYEVGQIKTVDNSMKYDRISNFMLSLLVVPHSNAECERVFSMVRKNRNLHRSSLSDNNLENLLLVKSLSTGVCYEQTFDKTLLEKAKKATVMALKPSS